jgi:WD40 repeat protein
MSYCSKNGKYSDGGNTLTLWDTARHKAAKNLIFNDLGGPVTFSPVGPLIAACSAEEPKWILLNTATGTRTLLASLPPDRWPLLVPPLFSPDGRLVATFGNDRSGAAILNLHETAAGEPIADVQVTQRFPREALFSPDSRHFAVSSNGRFSGGDVYWWDLDKGVGRAQRQLAPSLASGMAFSPDSRLLAAAINGKVQIWRLSLADRAAGAVVNSR